MWIKIFSQQRKQSAAVIFTISRLTNLTFLVQAERKCLFLQGELYFSSLLFWHSDKDSLRIKELEVKQQNMLDMHYSSLLKTMSHEGLRSMWITEILSKISIKLRIMWDLYFSCFVCALKHITCSSKITQLSVWDPVTDKDTVYGPVCGE